MDSNARDAASAAPATTASMGGWFGFPWRKILGFLLPSLAAATPGIEVTKDARRWNEPIAAWIPALHPRPKENGAASGTGPVSHAGFGGGPP